MSRSREEIAALVAEHTEQCAQVPGAKDWKGNPIDGAAAPVEAPAPAPEPAPEPPAPVEPPADPAD